MSEQESPSQEIMVEAVGASVRRTHSPSLMVEDLHWRVAAGEFWVVGGRHGSGKSAFLSTMAGLHSPAAGVVRHFGQDLSQLSESDSVAQRLRIGFVFKGGGRMFPDLTVAGNVSLPLRYHRDWDEEQAAASVQTLLETTELAPLAGDTAQFLTTGWQQRVGLARALALEPEVLFLDEPMAGLEAGHRRWWRDFLEQLSNGSPFTKGRKITLIVVTSDFELWSGARLHFALIKDGHWQTLGERDEIPDLD